MSTVPCGEGGFPSPVDKLWGRKKWVTLVPYSLQNKSPQTVRGWRCPQSSRDGQLGRGEGAGASKGGGAFQRSRHSWAIVKISIGFFCYSVAQLCPTPCNPMDCSTPGFPDLHYLLELVQLMDIDSCHPSISCFVIPFSCPQPFPASGSFPMTWFFASGGQSSRASASASVLPINAQD